MRTRLEGVKKLAEALPRQTPSATRRSLPNLDLAARSAERTVFVNFRNVIRPLFRVLSVLKKSHTILESHFAHHKVELGNRFAWLAGETAAEGVLPPATLMLRMRRRVPNG
ncbi:hypothetical protein BH18ACI4_BH18ACI4_13700 [soil metagenome]